VSSDKAPPGANAARAPASSGGSDLGRAKLQGTAAPLGSETGSMPPPTSRGMEHKRITPRSPRAALEPDHVPLPTRALRPSRRARNPLVILGNAIFTALVLLLVAGGALVAIGKSRFEAPGPLQEDKLVVIPPRSGLLDIADLLKHEGVIGEHRLVFIGGVFALNARSELKAGEYLFAKGASVRSVVETIADGKVVQHQITIPEGLTSEQIVARVLENDILTGNIKDIPREGSLLPDSYNFHRGFTREQMIQRMRSAQERLVRKVWERRGPDLPIKTPDQLVTLASIIEKETAVGSDHHLRPGLREGFARSSHHQDREGAANALQHLHHRRPAARADCQPRSRFDRSRRQSGAHQGTLFRSRRHRRTRVRGNVRSAFEKRRAVARVRT